ncbi:hypothetical protein PI124_g19423, partial [Phytophthora idaei]
MYCMHCGHDSKLSDRELCSACWFGQLGELHIGYNRESLPQPKHQPHDTLLALKPRSVRMTHPNGEFMVGHLRHRQINADSWTVGMCQEDSTVAGVQNHWSSVPKLKEAFVQGRGLDVEAIFSLVQLETNVEMHCGTEESSSVPWR